MNESMTDYQKAFLLLQLLGAGEGGIQKSLANKWVTANARLGLKKASDANKLRATLIPKYITERRGKTEAGGTADFYEITDDGLAHLLELEQYPLEIKVPGRAINRLVEAALNGRAPTARPASESDIPSEPPVQTATEPTPTPTPQPAPTEAAATAVSEADLTQAILQALEELLREQYSFRGSVPIYEIRRWVAERLGPDAARHDRFNPAVKSLDREGRVKMQPINDMSRATYDQLNESIPGVHVTWFYLEPAS